MRLMLDFRCDDCGEVTEWFVDSKTTERPCECGGLSHRVISTPTIKLDGTSGHFPTAADNWARVREQNHRINAKKTQN